MNKTPLSTREKTFGEHEFIVSKTDLKGIITYGNTLFIKISGYSEQELLGTPHNILRHPDMPACVFELLWRKIENGEEVFAYVKNLAKDGSFYWVFAQVTPSYDKNNTIVGYHSVRRCPKPEQIRAIEPIYKKMLQAEKQNGMEAGKKILADMLAQSGKDYDEFIFTL